MVMSLITVFNVPFEDYALLNDPKSRSNFFSFFFFQIFHGMNYRGYSHSIIVMLVIVKNNDECKSYNVKDDFLKMFYMKYIISKRSNRIKKL